MLNYQRVPHFYLLSIFIWYLCESTKSSGSKKTHLGAGALLGGTRGRFCRQWLEGMVDLQPRERWHWVCPTDPNVHWFFIRLTRHQWPEMSRDFTIVISNFCRWHPAPMYTCVCNMLHTQSCHMVFCYSHQR